MLDLPVDGQRSAIDHWHLAASQLVDRMGLEHLPVRLMIDRRSIRPTFKTSENHVRMGVEEDSTDYRGTAGVLRDLAEEYGDDDVLLVANAAQLMIEPLADLVMSLAAPEADVSIVSHDDGTPSGVMLVRCGALRMVPGVGFVDMKEQALPRIARTHHVNVVRRAEPAGLPIRTLANYIQALRAHHGRIGGTGNDANVFAEAWWPMFGIVEPGAEVEDGTRVHDSVVLRGGRVERGAVLVRSIVCPGAAVRRNEMVADRLVVSRRRRNGKQ